MEKIKVAEVIGKYVGGGLEEVVLNYTSRLDKEKFDIDFIIDEDSTFIPTEKIKNAGINIIIVPPYQKVFAYQKALIKVFKENKYDIVHSHENTLSVFPLRAAKRAGVKIRIAHSHSTTNSKEKKRNMQKQILRLFSKLYATDYMACSELAGRWLFGNDEFEKGNVFVLNNAIDLEKFKFNEKIRKEKRKELNIEDDTLVIGHIGRFVTQKNHSQLIEIFYELQNINSNSKLLLIGQGPLQEVIKYKVNSLNLQDKVLFLGQRNDVNELYQAFDCFVLPSLYEGLPVVGVESQAMSLPCIFSDDMTKETKLLKHTKFLSLDKSPKEWANEILESVNGYQRKDTSLEISNNGFNLNKEAIKLENKYIEYFEKYSENKIKVRSNS